MRSENLRRPLQPQRHPGSTPAAPPDGTLAAASATSPGRPERTVTQMPHRLLRLCEKPLHAPQVTVSIFLKNCELYHRSMYCESKLNSYLGGNRPQCERSANPNSH